MSVSAQLRALLEERAECINPKMPDDMPKFCRDLADSKDWRQGKLARAGEIEREINEAVRVMREYGVLPDVRHEAV